MPVPAAPHPPLHVAVVGGGVIGLSCAWELARHGHRVTLVAPAPLPAPEGASWVAAGMLAPVTEAQFGEAELTALLLEGAACWKDFAATLEQFTGHDIGYDESGTLTVALDTSDRATLDDLLAYQHSLGLTAHRRTASACRALVPGLAPTVCGGIEVPGDHQVDNRALLGALVAACQEAGVQTVTDTVAAVESFESVEPVESVEPGPTLTLHSGGRIGADHILLAAGTALRQIEGLGDAGLPELRPVKGHILRLGPSASCPTPAFLPRTVRGLVRGRTVYLVPRRDGTVVVGATVEERSDGDVVQAGAVYQLLNDARALVPAIDELTLLEAVAGLRPATPDNRPFIGWTQLAGVAVATGHFRHGFLLAPLTASIVTALLEDRSPPCGLQPAARPR
jgi:glycine oxidase